MEPATSNVFRLFPETASTGAGEVDAIFFALFWLTVFICILIFGCIIWFSWRYRKSAKNVDRNFSGKYTLFFEIGWTVIPIIVGMVLFVWSAKIYIHENRIPQNGLEVYVVAKQWMWKAQHSEGPREINELHVPIGTPVKLLMTSQDVIHSFFVPEFRNKRDVLPGRFESAWFTATKTGEFHLFCAEYCGTEHSRMKGRIIVMETNDYKNWIAKFPTNEPPAITGAKLFQQYGCNGCHGDVNSDRGPSLVGIYGKSVSTKNGIIDADETYLANSIENPSAQLVAGYGATMPSYKEQLDRDQVVALVAYLKSLGNIEKAQRSNRPFLTSVERNKK